MITFNDHFISLIICDNVNCMSLGYNRRSVFFMRFLADPTKKPTSTTFSPSPSPSILKKDTTYDYSSQSEGESSHSTTSLSKGKKVFKPNLGARRRKRLSSFSAYSSCDEDEDDKQKRKSKVCLLLTEISFTELPPTNTF